MAKSEKKKYTKKNITNKIHKSKKNSGTAKKKAFRKSKKVGGLKKGDKPTIETNVNHNKYLFNEEMRKPAKKRNLNNMREYVDNINKGIAQLKTLEIHYGSDTEMVDRVSTTDLGFFYKQLKETEIEQATTTSSSLKKTDNKKPAQLDPLPPCCKQDFEKIDGKYTTKRFYVCDGREKTYQRPKSNEPCPNDIKKASNNIPLTAKSKPSNKQAVKPLPSNLTLEERRKRFKKEQEKAAQRASLEQRIKDAKAEEEAAKAERFKLEQAKKEAAEKAEQEKINATWSDSDGTWQESYTAGK